MPTLPHLEQPRIGHPITGCSDALGEGRIIFMTPRYACSNARAAVSNKREKNWRSRKFCYAAIVSSREHNRLATVMFEPHYPGTLVPEKGESRAHRSEEHTPELQYLMRISYSVFCLKKT